WGQVYTFLFPKERVGAKCTLGFFPKVFPKGNPMVHGEVGSRRPDVHTWRHRPHGGSTPVGANACGSLAVLQQAALRFALHHRIPLRISLLLTIGFPFYISLWDSARRPLRTVKSPQLSLRRVGARCTLFFFLPKGRVGAECTVFFFSRRGELGPNVHFSFSRRFSRRGTRWYTAK